MSSMLASTIEMQVMLQQISLRNTRKKTLPSTSPSQPLTKIAACLNKEPTQPKKWQTKANTQESHEKVPFQPLQRKKYKQPRKGDSQEGKRIDPLEQMKGPLKDTKADNSDTVDYYTLILRPQLDMNRLEHEVMQLEFQFEVRAMEECYPKEGKNLGPFLLKLRKDNKITLDLVDLSIRITSIGKKNP